MTFIKTFSLTVSNGITKNICFKGGKSLYLPFMKKNCFKTITEIFHRQIKHSCTKKKKNNKVRKTFKTLQLFQNIILSYKL